MKKLIIAVSIVGVALVGIAAISMNSGSQQQVPQQAGRSQDDSDQKTTQKPNSVTIQDYEFTPQNITVKKGATVTWTNNDIAKHNVVPEEGKDGGGLEEDAPLMAKGESYSHTFDKAGTFHYICSPHPYMKGTVTVIE